MIQSLELDQHYINSVCSPQICGIKGLACGILMIAFEDITSKKKSHYFDALEWFGADDTGYLFSFLNVCRILNLDPSKIRAVVESQKDIKPWLSIILQRNEPGGVRDQRSCLSPYQNIHETHNRNLA